MYSMYTSGAPYPNKAFRINCADASNIIGAGALKFRRIPVSSGLHPNRNSPRQCRAQRWGPRMTAPVPPSAMGKRSNGATTPIPQMLVHPRR